MHQFNVIVQVTYELNTTVEAHTEAEAREMAVLECRSSGEQVYVNIERNVILDEEEIDVDMLQMADSHSKLIN